MLTFLVRTLCAEPFDAAPFALSLPDGQGLLWEDPREIHQVVVEFETAPPESVRLEYWGSRWPEQHLPKDREPGGGDVGWMELGNWYNGGWRRADTTSKIQGATAVFEFNPVNAKEFPKLSNYPARFRYTLKLRVTSDPPLPKVKRFQALTDSAYKPGSVRVVWKSSPRETIGFEVFNGILNQEQKTGERTQRVSLRTAVNSDPNTFDRTQVTVKNGATRFTFAVDDLAKGPLFLPHFGAAILPDGDTRDYAALAAAQAHSGAKTLYDRVSQLPEQTWRSAWDNMPAKKSHIYFPMGLDGGRQRFLVEADGSIRFRSNDHFLRNRPGRDTPRLELERAPTAFHFGSWGQPKARHIEEDSMPICSSSWQSKGVEISQTVYVTPLGGSTAAGPVPAPDTCAVLMARFTLSNTTAAATAGELPLSYSTGDSPGNARWDEAGLLWVGTNLRGQVVGDHPAKGDPGHWRWRPVNPRPWCSSSRTFS
jgi:hypothetical protein